MGSRRGRTYDGCRPVSVAGTAKKAQVQKLPSAVELSALSASSVQKLLAGDPSTSRALFSKADYANKSYVTNPGLWCSGLNLSCFPVGGDGTHSWGGVLVTPRHAVYAAHAGFNDPVRLLAPNGMVVDRRVASFKEVVDDCLLVTLDKDVPGLIPPVKLFHPTFVYPNGTPFQDGRQGWGLWVDGSANAYPTRVEGLGTPVPIAGWSKDVAVAGDSGSPVALLLGRTPVLWTVVHFSSESGPGYFLDAAVRLALSAAVAPYKLSYYAAP